MTPDDPLASVIRRLAAAGCVDPAGEATELVAATTDPSALARAVARREQGEPLPWIVGSAQFCGHRVAVTPGVYVPRPQTEVLARRAGELLPPGGRAVDLCTGAGAVAVALRAAVPDATVVGIDLDPSAVACAIANGVPCAIADVASVPLRDGVWDVVIAVAPYVPTDRMAVLPRDAQRYEPRRALDGGSDGLTVVRAVVRTAARLLRHGGWLLAEVGGDQDERLASDLATSGLGSIVTVRDGDGDLRGVVGQLRGAPSSPRLFACR